MLTTEELRTVALEASAKRGKSVSQRRVARRWVIWVLWGVLLPLVGVLSVSAALAGFVFWQYMGHKQAYVAAQKWVQQEFGKFQTNTYSNINTKNNDVNGNNPAPIHSETTSLIPLTDEATPDLQIDRNLTIKTKP